MTHRRSRGPNDTSKLLNSEETAVLSRLIGNRCVSLATTVGQILVAPGPSFNRWRIECTGALTFVKDNPKRSYFIRMYDIKSGGLQWEQEIYNQFKYKEKTAYFHTFESDDSPTGLNFANEEEAYNFGQAVQEKLGQRKQRRDARRKEAATASSGSVRPQKIGSPRNAASNTLKKDTYTPSATAVSVSNVPDGSGKDTLRRKAKGKDKDKGKKKLTKSDIGAPANFRHVGHVGWDPEKGFDVENLDPDLKVLFDEVGVSVEQLKDKETADFIYDFIEKQGGLDKVKQDIRVNKVPPPPPPAMNRHIDEPPSVMAPPPPGRSMGYAPPPPPSRSGAPPPPPPPSRGPVAPPPPPPSRSGRTTGAPPPPPPPVHRGGPPSIPSSAPPPPPPPSMSAPPPPPPPSIGGPPPPPPPPAANVPPPPPPPSGKANLLSEIQTGASLKHVSPTERKQDSRGDLLTQIRVGQALKKVDASQKDRPKSDEPQDGIAGALARALAARAKGVQGDEDSDDVDSDDDDDEDWD